jgi:Domain of unknown function (DUF4939)
MPPRTRSGAHFKEPEDIDSPVPPLEPLEEPTPDPPEPIPDSPEHPPADLAQAITLLANSLSTPKKSSAQTKVREPDTFDGSDTRKLQSFLVQCALNFRDRTDAFSDDSAKVIYALSYLKGTALDWFEPALTSNLPAPWLSNYAIFISELKSNFGPHDPEGEAEAELESLCMRDNQRITKYLVEFQRLAARVQWGDAALRQQLYNGLPSQIKDEIACVGKPNTLDKLRTLAQTIDARYWECRSEVARETSGGKTQERQNDKGKSPATTTQEQKTPSSSTSGPSRSSSTTTSTLKYTSDLSSKLSKDGKLTLQE